jgi:hypothetical protein
MFSKGVLPMDDERTEDRDPLQPERPAPVPPGPVPGDKPRTVHFEDEWDDAPTTNTFRFPRS